jgi:heme/copper-type cytochrome/quinol oxidase subunit 2
MGYLKTFIGRIKEEYLKTVKESILSVMIKYIIYTLILFKISIYITLFLIILMFVDYKIYENKLKKKNNYYNGEFFIIGSLIGVIISSFILVISLQLSYTYKHDIIKNNVKVKNMNNIIFKDGIFTREVNTRRCKKTGYIYKEYKNNIFGDGIKNYYISCHKTPYKIEEF